VRSALADYKKASSQPLYVSRPIVGHLSAKVLLYIEVTSRFTPYGASTKNITLIEKKQQAFELT